VTLVFHNNKLLFVNGLLAKDPACCCAGGGGQICACCPHLEHLCLINATLSVSITGALFGSGTMNNPDATRCPLYDDNGITLTENCGDPGFSVTMELTCIGGTRCILLLFGWIDALLPICTIIPDTSRGAESDGFFSFQCDPLMIVFHFKTSGVDCECGDGALVTVEIAE
jgi:hypothetical protein